MARVGEWGRRISRGMISYKKITIAICSLNLISALLLLKTLYVPFSRRDLPLTASNAFLAGRYSADHIRRIEEAIRVRQAAEPVELANLVNKFRKELREEERRWKVSDATKQEMAGEILRRLRRLKSDGNEMKQKEAVELWRVEKLKEVKRTTLANLTSNSNIPAQEAKMLERALELDWLKLLEDIGFWMPANVNNTEIDDKPENAQELEEEEIIPGRPMPPECRAELHTDYDGIAVKWGLTHHKETAADCCQSCLDHAKNARPGERKCNIWVYCPLEYGCYSPDIYEHKHQECWLKQAEKPRLNFKDKYSENYRNSHPTAPIVVPWMSGVVAA